jgi:hypothetical protein
VRENLICWEFWVVRVLVLHLDGNQWWTEAIKVREVLFVEKRKERPPEGTCRGNQKLVVC